MSTAVSIKNVSKIYRLGVIGSGTLHRDLSSWWARVRGKPDPFLKIGQTDHGNRDGETIWALKDVSFEVKEGEIVGIIGRNGAGKSTLLKILSRVTAPTSGEIKVRGRVASLLEVGTGFHPELTGRENIFLNGAILGMTKAEIKRKLDEIVAFAEIDQFLETPVKRYSSGMYVRLAFAVAAHLDPEILVVDEVLAVGDAAFQKKCIGKMSDVAKGGRTVLFVSHNMAALSNLCPRSVLLVSGTRAADGETKTVIGKYISIGNLQGGEIRWEKPAGAPGNEKVRLLSVRILSQGQPTVDVDIEKSVVIELQYWNLKEGQRLSASIHLIDGMGVGVLASANMTSASLIEDPWYDKPMPQGLFRTTCEIPGNFLNEGRYAINVILLSSVHSAEISLREILAFTVHDTGAMRKEYGGGWLGVVRPKLAWQTEQMSYLASIVDGG